MTAARSIVLGVCLAVLAGWNRAARAACPPNPEGGPSLVVFDTLGGGDLDLGWTGTFFNFPTVQGMRLRGCLSRCDMAIDPTCVVAGPTGPGSTNGVMLGPPTPLMAGGVPLCVVNRFAITGELGFVGTIDLSSGATTLDIPLSSEFYLTDPTRVCPRCETGTCDSGPNRGRACTVHGSVRVEQAFAANKVFQLSQDCPPDPSQLARASLILLDDASTGGASTPGTGGSTPCTVDVANGVTPQDDNCGGGSCGVAGGCTGNACVTLVPHPVDAGTICVDAKGGLSQSCCNQNTTVPCHPTFPGGPGIVRQGRAVGATTPSPWGDGEYPKTASGSVLVATFCQPPTGTSTVDITMGLPGPAALILPVNQTWSTSQCGNGVAEADEQCDDGNVSDDDCCTTLCLPAAPGTACDSDDLPCTTDACDAAGACAHVPGNAGTECRAPEDECDAGDVCDGLSADCPSTGRGQACAASAPDVVAENEPIPVTCESSGDPVRGGSRCRAVGFAAPPADESAVTPTVIVLPPDSLGPQVTKRVKKKLRRVAGQAVRRRVLALKLNRLGKRLLKERGSLDVFVRVDLRNGQGSNTQFLLVSVRPNPGGTALSVEAR